MDVDCGGIAVVGCATVSEITGEEDDKDGVEKKTDKEGPLEVSGDNNEEAAEDGKAGGVLGAAIVGFVGAVKAAEVFGMFGADVCVPSGPGIVEAGPGAKVDDGLNTDIAHLVNHRMCVKNVHHEMRNNQFG